LQKRGKFGERLIETEFKKTRDDREKKTKPEEKQRMSNVGGIKGDEGDLQVAMKDQFKRGGPY